MEHAVNLVNELAVILITAGFVTVLFKWLKQPLILGYLVAGFLVGPKLGLLPEMTNAAAIDQWSQIGIVFLLFALGLEFSFKKLLKVGSSALIQACTKCVGMFIIGHTAGTLMGWTNMESIFLGGLMSMSSTTIILKTYDEMGLKKRPYAELIFGSLVIEDMIAVILMVLLSTIAVSNNFAGGEMVLCLLKLVFYLILWFVLGIYLLPSILKKAKPYLSDEILLILSIGLCFGMVTLAEEAGFSSALGAFVMGSILSETIEGERISKLMVNIKNLFGAIFFVSVGMMVDPAVIGEHWLTILVITLVAMCGIMIMSPLGSILAGKGLDTAVHAGFTLAQLGEFSFIIASLGCSLGVMRGFIYPVIIAVSVITTFTTPYMIKAADPVYNWLTRVLPTNVLEALGPRQDRKNASTAEEGEWKSLLTLIGIRVGIYFILAFALHFAAINFLPGLISKFLPSAGEFLKGAICLAADLVVTVPFILGMSVSYSDRSREKVELLVKKKESNRWPLSAMIAIRYILGVLFVISAAADHVPQMGLAIMVSLTVVGAILLLLIVVKGGKKNMGLETRFLSNFNAKADTERRNKPITSFLNENLAGYDIHLENYTVRSDFKDAGSEIQQLDIIRETGINIVKIKRGEIEISVPRKDVRICPADVLFIVGTEEQIQAFVSGMDGNVSEELSQNKKDMSVVRIEVSQDSQLYGKTLKEMDFRKSGCVLISVMRNGSLKPNPGPEFRFEAGDVAWLAGEKDSCNWYK